MMRSACSICGKNYGKVGTTWWGGVIGLARARFLVVTTPPKYEAVAVVQIAYA